MSCSCDGIRVNLCKASASPSSSKSPTTSPSVASSVRPWPYVASQWTSTSAVCPLSDRALSWSRLLAVDHEKMFGKPCADPGLMTRSLSGCPRAADRLPDKKGGAVGQVIPCLSVIALACYAYGVLHARAPSCKRTYTQMEKTLSTHNIFRVLLHSQIRQVGSSNE